MTLPSFNHLGEAGRPALVLLHGVGSGKEGFSEQKQAIINSGWQFIAIDAPGFGDTPLPSEPGFTDHETAVLDVLDHLDIERAAILGHSLGGMTAQEFYAHHPDRVIGLILSATSPAFGKPDGDFQKEFLRARLEPFEQGMTMREFAKAFSGSLVGSSPKAGAIEAIETVMGSVSIAAYTSAMQTLTQFDQRANLPNINVPTFLIAGDQDKNSPAAMMEKMASKIPHARCTVLRNTGHMAPIENPAPFNDAVATFLRETTFK